MACASLHCCRLFLMSCTVCCSLTSLPPSTRPCRYPGLHWYVPLGLKRWFSSRGIHTVTELDWWEEVQHSGSKV